MFEKIETQIKRLFSFYFDNFICKFTIKKTNGQIKRINLIKLLL